MTDFSEALKKSKDYLASEEALEYSKRLLEALGEGPYYYTFKRMLLWGARSC